MKKYIIFMFSGGVVNVNGLKLSPRIVLMTDGKPSGTSDAQVYFIKHLNTISVITRYTMSHLMV